MQPRAPSFEFSAGIEGNTLKNELERNQKPTERPQATLR
jgi:hypothetical protein